MMVRVAVSVQPATSCLTLSQAFFCMSSAFTTAGPCTLHAHKTSQYIFNQTYDTYTYTTQTIYAGTHIPIHILPSVNHIHT